ncbi:unnamed protein product [Parnassius mnemosyne]|uniref:PD-(D/E)XK endonuclease-like domain-containing protein n=1 Tax=Parnassius mnemosyne TaxID=213953 RepID=A0AAV1LY77_9NEOP
MLETETLVPELAKPATTTATITTPGTATATAAVVEEQCDAKLAPFSPPPLNLGSETEVEDSQSAGLLLLPAAAANRTEALVEEMKRRNDGWLRLHADQKLITFDEKLHIYYYNGCRNDISVTKLLTQWFPFDADSVAVRCVRSKKYAKCVIRDAQTMEIDEQASANNIKKEWDKRAEDGTKLHAELETFLKNGQLMEPERFQLFDGMLSEFSEFMQSNRFQFYAAEVRVFSAQCYEGRTVAGSIDALYYNNLGEAIIVDWKRSSAVFDFFNNRGQGLLSKYPNTNFWKYSAQLNIYAVLLKKKYNIQTRTMILVFFSDDLNNKPTLHHVPLMPELMDLFE